MEKRFFNRDTRIVIFSLAQKVACRQLSVATDGRLLSKVLISQEFCAIVVLTLRMLNTAPFKKVFYFLPEYMKKFLQKNVLPIAFLQSAVGMVVSLFFSEVMKLPPCVLCWYQRIAMYPLVVIFMVGLMRKDKNVVWYALPFSILGLIIAIYHNLLYYGIIPESIQPCTTGVSCTTKFFEWFGFITIPLLSLAGFLVITACLIAFLKLNSEKSVSGK